MEKTVVNMKNLRVSNRAAILKSIFTKRKASQKDLADELNLTAGAVSLICNEMIESNILNVTGETTGKAQVGRKQVLVEVNYNYKYLIGVDISKRNITLTLTNMKAEVIDQKLIDFNGQNEYTNMFKEIATEIIKILWKNNIQKDLVIAVGVTIIGIVDEKNGISLSAYKILSSPINIKEVLEAELGLKVFVENNVCAFAVGEALFSASDNNSTSLFVKWGPGVGSALILNNNIYKGNNHSSAEIGHTIVKVNGDLCTCGSRGCVESIVSLNKIASEVQEMGRDTKNNNLITAIKTYSNIIDSKNIVELLLVQDVSMKVYLNDLINTMAYAVYNSTKVILPERIILYGYMFESKDIYESFIQSFNSISNNKSTIEFCKSNYNVAENYIGAIAIAFQRGFLDLGGLV